MGESYPFVRYLYLMRLVGDQIVFLVDTQPPRFTDTAELAMPGEIYEDAQESLFRLFSQDHPVTVGPETDKWGTFVSALTTVTDKQGNIIAVIGADIESSNWDRQVYLHLLPTLFFTLFSSLLSFFLVSSYHKRQQYQQKLEHLALVLETSHDAIATISPDGVVMTWNQGAIAIFGYTATEAIGKKVTDLVYPGKQLDDYQKIYQLPTNGQQLVNHKAIRRTKTGKMVVLLVSATPIYQNGEFIGTTVIGKDITQDAGKESVLVARNQELEKLNQSMVDREIEMVNLKNKIKELEASRKK